MAMNRRREDNCFIVRAWKQSTPYAQIIGFFVMAAGIYTGFVMQGDKAQAAEQNVSILMDFKDKTSTDMATIKAQLQDIHDFLMGKK